MSYEKYCAKYFRMIAKLVKLGLVYARKTFWRLTTQQYQRYYRGQFAAMRQAIATLEG